MSEKELEQEEIIDGDPPKPDDPPKIDYEAEARKQGWRPKGEFDGEDFVDAETFVKRGKEIAGFLKKDNQKLMQELSEIKRTMGDHAKFLQDAANRNAKAEFDQRMKEYEEKQEAINKQILGAVEDGNTQLVAELLGVQGKMEKPILAPEVTVPQPSAIPTPEFDRWHEQNPWYKTPDQDPNGMDEMSSYADNLSRQYADEGMPPTKVYEMVARRIREVYPEKFAEETKRRSTMVESGQRVVQQQASAEKTFANLPPEAQAECKRFCKIIDGFTEKEYLENYQWD